MSEENNCIKPGNRFTVPAKTPHVLNFDRVLFVDVDDTIITFDYPPEYAEKTIMIGPNTFRKAALPMTKNIEGLKRARTRGHGVVVWSQGGYEWAQAVVKALDLEEYVDLIVTKPSWVYDDLPVEEWIGPRFWREEFKK